MKLIVGLGNPGREHRQHRHNIGFMVVDYLAEQHHIALSRVQMKAIMGSGTIAGRPVILAKPQTYMNRSGEVVGGLARFYQIDPPQLLVIYDELDLPFGTLRLRKQGGSGLPGATPSPEEAGRRRWTQRNALGYPKRGAGFSPLAPGDRPSTRPDAACSLCFATV